jgi:alkylation response protein AidB-like acyl-CoA dehydrogenase
MAALCEVLYALAREDASFAAVLLIDALARSTLMACGQPEAARADGLIGLPAYDLPHDPQRDLIATATDDGFTLTGRVEYVTLASIAGALLLPTTLADGGIGLFLVDAGNVGLTISPPVISLGLRGCPLADVTLAAVRVRPDRLLTRDARRDFAAAVIPYQAAAAALAAGIADGSFHAARAYTAERYQGGKMIIEYDMIRQMLAGIAVAAATGRALFRAMAGAADGSEGDQREAASLLASGFILAAEQASAVTTDGVQCLGGYGYMEDYGQEKRMRDAKQVQGLFGPAPARRLGLLAGILIS